MPDDKQKAVDENYTAFKKLLPGLLETDEGKFAVLREREVVIKFDTLPDALAFVKKEYSDGLYSIQQIIRSAVDLGYFSRVMYHRQIRPSEGADLENRTRGPSQSGDFQSG